MISYMNTTPIFTVRKDCGGSSGSNVTVGRAIHREIVAVEQPTDTGRESYTGGLFKATTLAQHSRDHAYNWFASMERTVSKANYLHCHGTSAPCTPQILPAWLLNST